MTTTTAQAFLFNADAENVSNYYGGDFEPPFLLALSAVDPRGAARSTVLRGDVIVSALCTRVTAVSRDSKGSSRTEGHDMDLYGLIIWDLADALTCQRHTLDLEQFPLILGRQNVYCITAVTLPAEFREGIDAGLRSTSGYLGSVEIDLGNPIQKRLLVDQLVEVAVIADGRITMELSWEGTPETTFEGSEQFKPNGERRIAEGGLDALKPSNPAPPCYSARGQLSADRYNGKRRYTVHDRVLLALSRAWHESGNGPSFLFTELRENEAVLEADLPEAKFVRYLLNHEHAEGRGKAKFFHDELGISASDWRYLAGQLYAGLKKANLENIEIKAWNDGYGASFNCLMPVLGLNGRVATIKTNWILRPGLLPQLATAFPAKRGIRLQANHEQTPIVPSTATGDARWEAVYHAAHEAGVRAAKACVPTPMKVSGYEPIMEGGCGFASTRVPDARKGFARWAVRSGKASSHFRSGVSIHARVASQSYDRAVAYAEAFATVLHLNGIKCSVEARYD